MVPQFDYTGTNEIKFFSRIKGDREFGQKFCVIKYLKDVVVVTDNGIEILGLCGCSITGFLNFSSFIQANRTLSRQGIYI